MGTKTLRQRSEMGKELDGECDFNMKYNRWTLIDSNECCLLDQTIDNFITFIFLFVLANDRTFHMIRRSFHLSLFYEMETVIWQ